MSRWTGAAVAALGACAGQPPDVCPGVDPVRTVYAEQAPDSLVNDLAVDAERVFWVDLGANEVRHVPKSGGSGETLAQAAAPRRIALDEQNVYWVGASGGVSSVSKSGGPVTVISPDITCSLVFPCGDAIAVDADTVYWATDAQLLSWPKQGGEPVALDAPDLYTGDVLVDSANVYWGALVFTDEALSFEVRASPKSGGLFQTIGALPEESFWVPYAMTADEGSVYVARSDGVWRFPKDASGPVQIAAGSILPRSISTDGVNVFVSARARVLRTPASGGELEPIACEQMEALHVAIDATDVYWSSEATAAIFSVPK